MKRHLKATLATLAIIAGVVCFVAKPMLALGILLGAAVAVSLGIVYFGFWMAFR